MAVSYTHLDVYKRQVDVIYNIALPAGVSSEKFSFADIKEQPYLFSISISQEKSDTRLLILSSLYTMTLSNLPFSIPLSIR